MDSAIKKALGSRYFPRVQLDLSTADWAKIFDNAFGEKLDPPFNPYKNSLNYLISTYTIPYVGLTGYVGASPLLQGEGAKAVNPLTPLIPVAITLLCCFSSINIFHPKTAYHFFISKLTSTIFSSKNYLLFIPQLVPNADLPIYRPKIRPCFHTWGTFTSNLYLTYINFTKSLTELGDFGRLGRLGSVTRPGR